MASPPSSTIPTLKSAFLRTQIRLLSAALAPSSTWRSSTDLPPKLLDTALQALNAHLTTHNRLAYPAQTQHHIAAQIDALYWSDVTVLGLHPPEPGETVVGREVDVSTPEGFEALPERYGELFLVPQSRRGEGEGEREARRYKVLRERLEVAMREQRRQRGRLEGYRELGRLLETFEGGGVQDDLGGVEGELERELERLKGLVGKVVGRMGEVEIRGGREGIGDGDVEMKERGEREKLRDVMDVL